MVNTLACVLVSLTFSTFFSKVRVTFVSSGGLHFRLSGGRGDLADGVLSVFCQGPRRFVSAVLIKGGVTLIICNLRVTVVLRPLVTHIMGGRTLVILARSVVSAVLVLFAKRFVPGAIFGLGPGFSLALFSMPLLVVCIILCPISGFSSLLSFLVLGVTNMGGIANSARQTLNGISLSCFVRRDVRSTPRGSSVSARMGVFRGTLSFSGIHLHSYVIPHARVITYSGATTLRRLHSHFMRAKLSGVLICGRGVSSVIKCVRSSRVFGGPRS